MARAGALSEGAPTPFNWNFSPLRKKDRTDLPMLNDVQDVDRDLEAADEAFNAVGRSCLRLLDSTAAFNSRRSIFIEANAEFQSIRSAPSPTGIG